MNTFYFLSIALVVSSFTTHFEQVRKSKMLLEPLVSKGALTYRTPDYVKWEYTTPNSLILESDTSQNHTSRHEHYLISLIKKTVRGDIEALSNDFEHERINNTLILKPKKQSLKNLFQSITICLDPDTHIATSVELAETNGDTTRLRFYDTVLL